MAKKTTKKKAAGTKAGSKKGAAKKAPAKKAGSKKAASKKTSAKKVSKKAAPGRKASGEKRASAPKAAPSATKPEETKASAPTVERGRGPETKKTGAASERPAAQDPQRDDAGEQPEESAEAVEHFWQGPREHGEPPGTSRGRKSTRSGFQKHFKKRKR